MDATTISHQSDESSWKFGDRPIRGIDYEIVTGIYDSCWRASWQSRLLANGRKSQCISQEDKASPGSQEYISLLQLLRLLWECSNSGSKAKNILHNLYFYHWIFNGSCLMLVFLMVLAGMVQYQW